MAKVEPKKMDKKEFEQLLEIVAKTISKLTKKHDALPTLLQQLLTPSEIVMLGRRIRIAQWLLTGKSCEEVREKLHAGRTTVHKVDHLLRLSCDSYEHVFPSLYWEAIENISEEKKNASKYSFAWTRTKYPLHFLLLNMFLDDREARRRLES
jgi:Trp operon repressor